MNRTGLLSTIAMILASSPSFAQFGGMGGMGGQGAAPGMMMRGGGRLGPGFAEIRRSVQVEMEGGQRLKGHMDLRPIIVDCDLGQYSIAPDKIKMIRFLKPANDAGGIGDGEAGGGDAKRWSSPYDFRIAVRRSARSEEALGAMPTPIARAQR